MKAELQHPFFLAMLSMSRRPEEDPLLLDEISLLIRRMSPCSILVYYGKLTRCLPAVAHISSEWFERRDMALDQAVDNELIQYSKLVDDTFKLWERFHQAKHEPKEVSQLKRLRSTRLSSC